MTRSRKSSSQQYHYICVLDFEATCSNHRVAQLEPREIIEFPSCLLQFSNPKTCQIVSEFQCFVKPHQATVSRYCEELTGISQELLDTVGIPFSEALSKHREWLTGQLELQHRIEYGEDQEEDETSDDDDDDDDEEEEEEEEGELSENNEEVEHRSVKVQSSNLPANVPEDKLFNQVLILTIGNWDLLKMFNQQVHISQLDDNHRDYQYLNKWCNLKDTYSAFYHKEGKGMQHMLSQLGIAHRGKLHSGIDDCRNVCRIVKQMASEGCNFQHTCYFDEQVGHYVDIDIDPSQSLDNIHYFHNRPGKFVSTIKQHSDNKQDKSHHRSRHEKQLKMKGHRGKVMKSWNKRQHPSVYQ